MFYSTTLKRTLKTKRWWQVWRVWLCQLIETNFNFFLSLFFFVAVSLLLSNVLVWGRYTTDVVFASKALGSLHRRIDWKWAADASSASAVSNVF
jgi:hypothetical protein